MSSQEQRIALINEFVEKINQRDIDGLVALADPNIELTGPRGSGVGHQLLRDWMGRANMTLETFATYARDDMAVLAQHGVWHSAEGEEASRADTFMYFRTGSRPREALRVVQFARYTDLQEALVQAGLSLDDEVA